MLLLTALLCLGVGRTINGGKSDYRWSDWQKIGKKVDEVTPANGLIDGDEAVFFITRRQPPPGMEYDDTHKLHLLKEFAAQLHVFSKEDQELRVKSGYYDTLETCEDEDKAEKQNLSGIYKQKAAVGDCNVYWDLAKPLNITR
jgi:hypothetical protein